jgi:hypothetical protein
MVMVVLTTEKSRYQDVLQIQSELLHLSERLGLATIIQLYYFRGKK